MTFPQMLLILRQFAGAFEESIFLNNHFCGIGMIFVNCLPSTKGNIDGAENQYSFVFSYL